MQQRIAQKEKESKEENLRLLAQRAREERSGIASGSGPARVAAPSGGAGMVGLAGYGSDSAEEDDEDQDEPEEDEDVAGAKEREEIRRERKKEREREMRMSNMGTEQRAKILARSVPFPFLSSPADSRLLSAGRPDETSQKRSHSVSPNLPSRKIQCSILVYSTKKLSPTISVTTIRTDTLTNRSSRDHRQRQRSIDREERMSMRMEMKSMLETRRVSRRVCRMIDLALDWPERVVVSKELIPARFEMGKFSISRVETTLIRIARRPVAFEKDVADPFGVDAFLDEAKKGTKRGLNVGEESSRAKRARD